MNSSPFNMLTLCKGLKQKWILKRLLKRIRKLRTLAKQYTDLQSQLLNVDSNLSEGYPKGTFQKVGLDLELEVRKTEVPEIKAVDQNTGRKLTKEQVERTLLYLTGMNIKFSVVGDS